MVSAVVGSVLQTKVHESGARSHSGFQEGHAPGGGAYGRI